MDESKTTYWQSEGVNANHSLTPTGLPSPNTGLPQPPPGPDLTEFPRLKPRFSQNIVWLWLSGSVMLVFLLVPILALLFRSFTGGALGTFLNTPTVVEALKLSLITTAITLMLAVVLGTPLAYLLARYRFPGYGPD